jgi:NADH:ubiquinone oxidoreductase subunit K
VNLSVALPLVGAALFSLGIFGVLARRNVLAVLMSIELLYNAAMINFVAFNRYRHPGAAWGQGVALFVLAIAAAEAVVGLTLVLVVYRRFHTVLAEKLDLLKG